MFPHAYPVTDDEKEALKILIKFKGDCFLTDTSCDHEEHRDIHFIKKYYKCPRDIQMLCKGKMPENTIIYSKAIEIYIDLFGEASLFEELL